MSNGPVPFLDIGKRAKDLLYRDYNFDQKFSLALSSDSGVGLTATGLKINQLFIGDLTTKYQSGKTTVDFKVDTDLTVSTTVTVNEFVTGLKSSLIFKVPDQKAGKLDLQYLHDRIALNSQIGLTSTPLLEFAASVGTKELSLGAEIGFDSSTASFTKYNAGICYSNQDFSTSLILVDKGETLKASYIHLIDPENSVGAELTHRFNSSDNNFTFGSSHLVDPLTLVKTRLSNNGKVALLCQHQWRLKSFVTVSAEYDTKAARLPAKVGLALALKP